MKKFLLVTVLSVASLFGFGYSQDTKLDANSIRDAGNDSLILTLKAQSPDLMVIKHTIEYNPKEFETPELNANSYFHLESSEETKEDNKILTILLDSENSFDSIEYLELKIKPVDKTTTGTIRLDNIEIGNSNHKIYKAQGSVLTVIIEDENYKLLKEEVLMQNPIVKYIRSHKKLVLTICGIVLLIIIINNIRLKVQKTKKKKYFTDIKTQEEIIEDISNEEGIELIQKVESEEKDNPISDDIYKGKYEVFIILLLIGSLLTITNVNAKSEYTQDIREAIINNKTYKETLDLNRDKKVNIIDLIYAIESKDTINKGNINFK